MTSAVTFTIHDLTPLGGYDIRRICVYKTNSASLVCDLKLLGNTNPRTEFHVVYSTMGLCVFTHTLSPFSTVSMLVILAARIATCDIRTHVYTLDSHPALRGRNRPVHTSRELLQLRHRW